MSETGKLFELAGKVVGQIVSENEKTLLVRKGSISVIAGQDTLILSEKAVFVSKHFVENAYWIKLQTAQPAVCVSESVDCSNRRNSIGEFLNV